MINNLEKIKHLLNFENDGDFYMLYVFKRKKDQPEAERSNHQSVRTIKTYCIESVDYLEKRYDEIKMLCEVFKARAYIHVQKQNHKDVGLNLISTIAQRLGNNQHNQKNVFDSVVGKLKTHEKRWVVDIDTKSKSYLLNVVEYINVNCRPYGEKNEEIIPTKSGYHLITKRFDVQRFREKFKDVDIQKKNPTLLYLPNSLS